MDIWAWVISLQRDLREAGHGRVADLIDSIPDDRSNSRPELVVAALPEALAAARALKNPWLEVFFRHWGLSNRMGNLVEGEVALAEAVSLIEFAHRDENMGCPQSVCATQDIAICYGNIDGPGWAPERLAVCEETLARINPAWPCFRCISAEYGEALLDAGRFAEAEAFLARQAAAIRNEGDQLTPSYQALQAHVIWQAGDPARALALLDEIDLNEDDDPYGADPEERRGRALLRARILCERGEFEAAAAAMPDWDELQPISYESWSHAASLLAAHDPAANTWQLGRRLQIALAHFSRVGAHADAVTVALRHAELALARGASWTARRALAIAQAHVLKLRRRDLLAPAVAELAGRLEARPAAQALPVPAAELVAHLQAREQGDPEQDVEWLLAACAERPDDAGLAQFAASALQACGTLEEARAHLWRFVQAHPGENAPIYRLLTLLLENKEFDELERLARAVAPDNAQAALWIRSQIAFRQKAWDEACRHLAAYVDNDPEAVGARHCWAAAALANQDLPTALRLRRELAADRPVPSDEHWDLLSIASASQDWTVAREVCALLGLEVQGESGPIEESWGVVYIRCEDGGKTRDLYARRTGPVTARILLPSSAPQPQRLGDWVAFDAALVEPRPEGEAEREHFVPTFRLLHTIEEGGFGESCFVDGAAPGEALFESFRAELESRGWHCWVSSPDDYTVTDPRTEESLPGLYFLVSAPKRVGPRELDQVLRELTAAWPHPVCWPRYAQRAGLDMARHEEIAQRYGL